MGSNSKKASQIRRNQLRAEARGEEYVAPPKKEAKDTKKENGSGGTKQEKVALRLHRELLKIEQDTEMNAKTRRSAKRKVEAIAAEDAGCTLEELMALDVKVEVVEVVEQVDGKGQKWGLADTNNNDCGETSMSSTLPYILFVGQIAFTTTAESLFDHFKRILSKDYDKDAGTVITSKNLRVRLLSDKRTGKSKGMAFVEVDNPQLLYECLKLHRSLLEGRRINVERTVGGGTKSDRRKERIQELRKEQQGTLCYVML
jgi:hypothetical protein